MALIGDLDFWDYLIGQVLQTLAISVYVPRQALSRGKTVAQMHHGEQRPTQQEAGKQTPTGPRTQSSTLQTYLDCLASLTACM